MHIFLFVLFVLIKHKLLVWIRIDIIKIICFATAAPPCLFWKVLESRLKINNNIFLWLAESCKNDTEITKTLMRLVITFNSMLNLVWFLLLEANIDRCVHVFTSKPAHSNQRLNVVS